MNKKLVVIGAGESGTGAAVLGKVKGWTVFVSDNGSIADKYKCLLNEEKIEWEEGNHSYDKILNADLVIKSPGVPETAELIKMIRAKGIDIEDEIEFAGRYTDAKMLCITGSNGKTTTTLLTYHILVKAGIDAGLAGNVGYSLAYQVAKDPHDCYVIELSSFQLDEMYRFKADFSVITNITPDHLDRYDYKIENYINSKFRIIQNMNKEDVFVYCADDELTLGKMKNTEIVSQNTGISLRNISGGVFTVGLGNSKIEVPLDSLSLKGTHNIYNSMVAALAALYMGVNEDIIKEGLGDFEPVAHRLEPIAEVNGVLYINDSKATNVNSCWYALESMTAKVIWIAGGKDKGNDYSLLNDFVRDKVKALVCLGVDNNKLKESFTPLLENIEEAVTTDEAVEKAAALAVPGDVVLLSPCCASFDLFKSYIDRGNRFKESVLKLKDK